MADGYKLWGICPLCSGAGKFYQWVGNVNTGGSLELLGCPPCGGSGYVFNGWCSVDTFTLPDDLPDAP
jgi:hypothetical protein